MMRTRRPLRDPTQRARQAEEHARLVNTDAAWLVAADAWEEAGDHRRAAQAQGRVKSVKQEIRDRLQSLFYDLTDDEMRLRRPPVNDAIARRAMSDALIRRIGAVELGRKLARWPVSQKLHGTLLHEKIRRAVFGPQRRQTYTPRKPQRQVLLARPGPRGSGAPWIRIDRWLFDYPSGRAFLFSIPLGHFSTNMLVVTNDGDTAIGLAEERWPHLLYDEIDPEEVEERDDAEPHPTKADVWVVPTEQVHMEELRPGRELAWARIVGHNEAFIRGIGVVRYHQ